MTGLAALEAGVDHHALVSRVASVRWYHSLQLRGDLITPGNFDTIDELRRVPLPRSLDGMRCLDVATADGFWAFEMERRSAAEVVAIDVRPERLDWPGNAERTGRSGPAPRELRGFDVAHEALGSRVRWREISVYELDPRLTGEFDFIFIGSVLMHLRDPVAALAAIRRVLRGELLSVDGISPWLTLSHPRRPIAQFDGDAWPSWWMPNLQAYRRMFTAADLEIVDTGRPFFVKRRPDYSGAFGSQDSGGRRSFSTALKHAAVNRLGNLHTWLRATAG